MEEYRRVYTMSNENIGSYKELYDFDGARLLTVVETSTLIVYYME